MCQKAARIDTGPIPTLSLEHLHDYLHIFEATSRPAVSFRSEQGRLTIDVDGEQCGYWTMHHDVLVFHGAGFAQVRSLQAAVLHTLKILAQRG